MTEDVQLGNLVGRCWKSCRGLCEVMREFSPFSVLVDLSDVGKLRVAGSVWLCGIFPAVASIGRERPCLS